VAEEASPRVAYRGFISYSHRDERAGAKLHRRLETYKLPKQLVGTETARGLVPQRLTPIFRDREELSAGVSLSRQVQDALAVSDALIILCSPHAKASVWVGKEIETFRALHPDRPILAAILEGDPDDAFPDALTQDGAEPIAADLRKGKDGWRLGQQKLIAGMTGVPLDALVQRDAQRQLRRVTAITVGALIAMLVLALLLAAALRARAEADRQRTEAEGLVEYMLTDLRDKLKGVGRLDVMTAVNERAMKHYGKQGDLASLPPESLNRRARILHAMGEDDEKRGDLGLALKKFEEAHRTTAAVLAQQPGDADAIFAHAQSEYWVGYIAWQKRDRRSTTRYWNAYRDRAMSLAKVEPKSIRAKMELSYSNGNLCDLNLDQGFDLAKAEADCQAAVRFAEAAVELDASYVAAQETLANRVGWLANVYQQQKRYPNAYSQRVREWRILDDLFRAAPKDFDLQYRLVDSQLGQAAALLSMGRSAAAEKILTEALARVEKMIAMSDADVKLVPTRMRVLTSLTRAQKALGSRQWRATLSRAYSDLERSTSHERDYSLIAKMRVDLASIEKEGAQ
jgi:tetratricopeptide (TPR) repeat protein